MADIRRLAPDDFRHLLVIETESFTSGYSPYFIKMIPYLYANTAFIALEGRSAQGYAVAALEQHAPQRAWILSLAVRPKYRGCGLGEKLMRHVLDALAELKVQEVFLTVAPENEGAIALYQKLGFAQVKPLKDFFGPGEHRIFFQKSLAD
ncbi:MAG: GNAT family N-acetyltransferase [Bacillota bacterium]|jgi:ribosomal protein S18 acetylase RimI-like enzyme